MLARDHATMTFPHAPGCFRCADAGHCNVCGGALDQGHCTNGRCRRCHDELCTPGSATEHGYGSFDAAVALVARLRKEAPRRPKGK